MGADNETMGADNQAVGGENEPMGADNEAISSFPRGDIALPSAACIW